MLAGPEESAAGANGLSRVTRGWVLVSLGERGGLMVHDLEKARFAEPAPAVEVRNTVGAGDALLAAAVHALEQGLPPSEWLRAGVATGSAATQLPPGHLPATDRPTARRQPKRPRRSI